MARKLNYHYQRGCGMPLKLLKAGKYLQSFYEPIRKLTGHGVVRALYEDLSPSPPPPSSSHALVTRKQKKPMKFKY